MIDLVLALAVTVPAYPIRNEHGNPFVVVGSEGPAATERLGTTISMEELLRNSAATYRLSTITEDRKSLRSGASSVTLTATFIMGGKINRPPLDDEFVYFDE